MLQTKLHTVYFSLALGKTIVKTDSLQVLYFIHAITDDFYCYEELLALGTLIAREHVEFTFLTTSKKYVDILNSTFVN